LLSSVVLASLSGARESARDTSRYQDFRQLRQAVNQYRNAEGSWPGDYSGNDQVSENCTGVDIYTDLVDGGYLQSMPTDPSESVVACGSGPYNGNSGDDDFFYAWDEQDNDSNNPEEACFGINNFEAASGAGELSDLNMVSAFDGGGGYGSLNHHRMDFIYCFEKRE